MTPPGAARLPVTAAAIGRALGLAARTVVLADLSTMGLGGPALLVEPRRAQDLARLLMFLRDEGLPFLPVGGASNILFPDAGLEAAVVRPAGDLALASVSGTTLLAGAGAPVAVLMDMARRAGLSGLEMAAGLPGTAGGAAMGNAGRADRGLADLLDFLELVAPDGETVRLSRDQLAPSYRSLGLPGALGGSVVASMGLALARSDPGRVREAERRFLADRAGQPRGRSLGCFFRNPPGESAGRLIDRCGLKGAADGGAEVSPGHANFILNRGAATADQVLRLAGLCRERVFLASGLWLEPEVRIVGPRGQALDIPGLGSGPPARRDRPARTARRWDFDLALAGPARDLDLI
ncbi:MAG: UDP-N-acetylmuramate dehydrogenase [Deltaproteobacteria bacterium]|nr:UDP-N-acetylmuramate dehydrogenase [Deltaproteobacteria bacterium]